MRTIIAAVCVCVASIVQAHDPAGHAAHHEHFYLGLKMPGTTTSCCNNKDCRPAQFRLTPTGVEFLIAGRWIMPPEATLMEVETPDAGAHWCGYREHTDAPVTYCAIIPRGGV